MPKKYSVRLHWLTKFRELRRLPKIVSVLVLEEKSKIFSNFLISSEKVLLFSSVTSELDKVYWNIEHSDCSASSGLDLRTMLVGKLLSQIFGKFWVNRGWYFVCGESFEWKEVIFQVTYRCICKPCSTRWHFPERTRTCPVGRPSKSSRKHFRNRWSKRRRWRFSDWLVRCRDDGSSASDKRSCHSN